jgi:hypothetical protein
MARLEDVARTYTPLSTSTTCGSTRRLERSKCAKQKPAPKWKRMRAGGRNWTRNASSNGGATSNLIDGILLFDRHATRRPGLALGVAPGIHLEARADAPPAAVLASPLGVLAQGARRAPAGFPSEECVAVRSEPLRGEAAWGEAARGEIKLQAKFFARRADRAGGWVAARRNSGIQSARLNPILPTMSLNHGRDGRPVRGAAFRPARDPAAALGRRSRREKACASLCHARLHAAVTRAARAR